jgi:hypothetical protein
VLDVGMTYDKKYWLHAGLTYWNASTMTDVSLTYLWLGMILRYRLLLLDVDGDGTVVVVVVDDDVVVVVESTTVGAYDNDDDVDSCHNDSERFDVEAACASREVDNVVSSSSL